MSKNFILELKSLDCHGQFSGYASVFNVDDSHNDIIKPGAFKESLVSKSLNKLKLLWQHQPELPVGIINYLAEDQHGLYIEAKLLLEIQQAYEAYILLKNKAISGLSIGYKVKQSYYDSVKNKRIITKIDLHEISLVTFPSNPQAVVTSIKSNDNESSLIKAINHALIILKS